MSSAVSTESPVEAFDDCVAYADTMLGQLEEARKDWVGYQLTLWRPVLAALEDALERAKVPGSGYAIAFGPSPSMNSDSNDADGGGGDPEGSRRGCFNASADTLLGKLRLKLTENSVLIFLASDFTVPQYRDSSLPYRKAIAKLLGEELGRTTRNSLFHPRSEELKAQLLKALDAVSKGDLQQDDVLEAAAALLARDAERRREQESRSERFHNLLEKAHVETHRAVEELLAARPEADAALFGGAYLIEQDGDALILSGSPHGEKVPLVLVRAAFSYSETPLLVVDICCVDMRVQNGIPSYPTHGDTDDIRERLGDMGEREGVALDQPEFRVALFKVLGMIARVGGRHLPRAESPA